MEPKSKIYADMIHPKELAFTGRSSRERRKCQNLLSRADLWAVTLIQLSLALSQRNFCL